MEREVIACPNRDYLENDFQTTCNQDCELCNGEGFVEDEIKIATSKSDHNKLPKVRNV